jgi:iron complex transport system ATP-binding protein
LRDALNIIDFNNVSFSYEGNKDFVIKDINFKIYNNEFISILGANGSGKSTLIKIAAGLLKPKIGNIKLLDKELIAYKRVDIAKLISYVPQLYYSVYPYTVYEIVMMGRNPHLGVMGFENKEDIELVDHILEEVGIYKYRNKSINEISSGEAQRAYVARALVQNAKIILLDEPNSHLDVKNEISLFKLLASLKEKENISIAIITHHINLAHYYSDNILMLKKGEVLYYGKPNKLLDKEIIIDCFDLNNDVDVIINNECRTINLMPH